MAQFQATNDSSSNTPHYSIYVYHNCHSHKSNTPWEMKGITHDLDEALEHARLFFNTRQFCKVEVKKRMYDTLSSQSLDTTIKVFETARINIINVITASAVLMTALILVVGSL